MPKEDEDPFDDFIPLVEPGFPFGRRAGTIPIGTLAEVIGIEKAQPILDALEAADRNQAREVARVLGRSMLLP